MATKEKGFSSKNQDKKKDDSKKSEKNLATDKKPSAPDKSIQSDVNKKTK